jgi:endonuclease-3
LETILAFDRTRAGKILKTLQFRLPVHKEDFASILVAEESHDPFRVLVVTILSQNCTDVAAVRAYRTLDSRIGVTSRSLSRARSREIASAIHVAGLYRQKAKALRQLSLMISQKLEGDLTPILNQPLEQARETLQEMPKVGPKTADVLLSVWGKPTISVDTHVERVAKRLGLTPPDSKYDRVRFDLMRLFEEADYGRVPILLMAHGRRYCKARRPLCPTCPIAGLCSYPKKTKE